MINLVRKFYQKLCNLRFVTNMIDDKLAVLTEFGANDANESSAKYI